MEQFLPSEDNNHSDIHEIHRHLWKLNKFPKILKKKKNFRVSLDICYPICKLHQPLPCVVYTFQCT